jgi:hypothetical protein
MNNVFLHTVGKRIAFKECFFIRKATEFLTNLFFLELLHSPYFVFGGGENKTDINPQLFLLL